MALLRNAALTYPVTQQRTGIVYNPLTGKLNLEPEFTHNIQVGEGLGSVRGALVPVQYPAARSRSGGDDVSVNRIALGQPRSNGFLGAGVNPDHVAFNAGSLSGRPWRAMQK